MFKPINVLNYDDLSLDKYITNLYKSLDKTKYLKVSGVQHRSGNNNRQRDVGGTTHKQTPCPGHGKHAL